MERPANAEEQAAQKLWDYWEGLVKHEKELANGVDKQFYELVRKCVDELWEEVVEKGTWQNKWQETLVWQQIKLPPGEAERRIRVKVRPWLAEARQLKYKRWWFTDGVDRVGDYVDRWFAGGKDGAAPAQGTRAKATGAAGSAENMKKLLEELRVFADDLVDLVDTYAKKV